MKTKYTATTRVNRKQLPVVVKALRAIEKEAGMVTPSLVVLKAESPNHPLHRYFTWDDTDAARKHRDWEARTLIQAVNVVFTDSAGDERTVRAFVNVRPDADETDDAISGQGYISVQRAAKSGSYKEQAIQYAHAQLKTWNAKFGTFKEFFTVSKAIAELKV